MHVNAQQGKDPNEVLKARKKAGAWLRERREAVGLSQREISTRVGFDYYTFISQIESGRGRLPAERFEEYARALGVPVRELALVMMRYYDPITYSIVFAQRDTGAAEESDLEARLRRLEMKLQGEP